MPFFKLKSEIKELVYLRCFRLGDAGLLHDELDVLVLKTFGVDVLVVLGFLSLVLDLGELLLWRSLLLLELVDSLGSGSREEIVGFDFAEDDVSVGVGDLKSGDMEESASSLPGRLRLLQFGSYPSSSFA